MIVEASATAESPRETNPKVSEHPLRQQLKQDHDHGHNATRDSEDEIPIYLHCGDDSMTDEQVEMLFEEFERAMLRGNLDEILSIIETLKRQRREDINDGLRCLKRRLMVFLNTESGFF